MADPDTGKSGDLSKKSLIQSVSKGNYDKLASLNLISSKNKTETGKKGVVKKARVLKGASESSIKKNSSTESTKIKSKVSSTTGDLKKLNNLLKKPSTQTALSKISDSKSLNDSKSAKKVSNKTDLTSKPVNDAGSTAVTHTKVKKTKLKSTISEVNGNKVIKIGEGEIVKQTVKILADGTKVVTTIKKTPVRVIKKRTEDVIVMNKLDSPKNLSQVKPVQRKVPSPAPPSTTNTPPTLGNNDANEKSKGKLKIGKRSTLSKIPDENSIAKENLSDSKSKSSIAKTENENAIDKSTSELKKNSSSLEKPLQTQSPDEISNSKIESSGKKSSSESLTKGMSKITSPPDIKKPPFTPEGNCTQCGISKYSPVVKTPKFPDDHKCPTMEDYLRPQLEEAERKKQLKQEKIARNIERIERLKKYEKDNIHHVKDKYYLCVRDESDEPTFNTPFANKFCYHCKYLTLPEKHMMTRCNVCRNIRFDDIPLLI